MKWSPLVLLAAGVLLAADAGTDDASKKDLEKLQGDWAAVEYTVDGQKLPDDDAQALFRTVKGNEYAVSHFDRVVGKGTFTIDATKDPKTVDFLPATAKDKSQALLGIYKVAGGRVTYCYAAAGKERPKEFASKAESMHTLVVWEREKK
ncbi:MAG TPA: TIGR03067 domain-containing protein [Gemmataceae bacterium]|nr:TIGR03067 domain-containing protein [Gemmataceae bacterium]